MEEKTNQLMCNPLDSFLHLGRLENSFRWGERARVKFPLVYYVLESAGGVIWIVEKETGTIDRRTFSQLFSNIGVDLEGIWILNPTSEKFERKCGGWKKCW